MDVVIVGIVIVVVTGALVAFVRRGSAKPRRAASRPAISAIPDLLPTDDHPLADLPDHDGIDWPS